MNKEKKKPETPAEKLVRYRQAYKKATDTPRARIDDAVNLLYKRVEDVKNEVTVILEKLLNTGFLDCEINQRNELVIEVSPYNRDPLDRASEIMRVTGFKMLRFLIAHDVMEVTDE